MTQNKDDFMNQLKKQYDDLNYRWSRERDKFEAGLQHESAAVRKEYEAKREAYRKVRKELKEQIVELDVASDNAWEELKTGAENSWTALTDAFDRASAHFKK
jgi:hypothetical protein